jgi:hypothetical protein
MNRIEGPDVHRLLQYEMMCNIARGHKKTNGMTSRLLTRAETNAFEHDMLTMYQTIDTLGQMSREGLSSTDMHNIYQLRAHIKNLNVNISQMSKEEFEKMKYHEGLRKLAAENLKQAHALAYEVKTILNETEEHRKQQGNSPFHWEQHGLLHMELARVITNISTLVDDLLPGGVR